MRSYPEELKQIAETTPENDLVLIGRTKRAFETHPETQKLTEGIGNMVSSKILGFNNTHDILGTTWIMTPQLAKMILEQACERVRLLYTVANEVLAISRQPTIHRERRPRVGNP